VSRSAAGVSKRSCCGPPAAGNYRSSTAFAARFMASPARKRTAYGNQRILRLAAGTSCRQTKKATAGAASLYERDEPAPSTTAPNATMRRYQPNGVEGAVKTAMRGMHAVIVKALCANRPQRQRPPRLNWKARHLRPPRRGRWHPRSKGRCFSGSKRSHAQVLRRWRNKRRNVQRRRTNKPPHIRGVRYNRTAA